MDHISVKSLAVRIGTDKPINKTPYQIKGVFIRQFPKEDIIPFLDGGLRHKYFYPRIQVKVFNNEIYIIGIKEGIDPLSSLIQSLNFFKIGDLSVKVDNIAIEENTDQFLITEKLIKYKFITPWVGINRNTDKKYRSLNNEKKIHFLNKLIGQNLLFISKEFGLNHNQKIYIKTIVDNLIPEKLNDNGWSAFSKSSFKTNFILPSYIGLGNGITRGFGTVFSLNNPSSELSQISEEKSKDYTKEEIVENADDIYVVSKNDDLNLNNRKKPRKKNKNKKMVKQHQKSRMKNKVGFNKKSQNKNNENNDESRFNSEEYHQKQHDF